MSNTADLIADMVREGVSADIIGRVAAALAQREVVVVKDEAAERRREKDRERKRSVRGIPQTSAESADPCLPSEVSPHTPLPNNPQSIPPSPPKGGSSPTAKPKARATKRAPDGWQPSSATAATLEAEGYGPGELERALSMVRDHEFAKPRTDWDATYRNWVRRDPPRGSHDRPAIPPRPGNTRAEARSVWADIAADANGAGAVFDAEPRRLAG